LTYTPSSRPMGELPVESSRRGGSSARWLIPLVLLAVIAVAAYYELSRPQALRPAAPDGIMPPPAPNAAPPSSPAPTPLPNPLDGPKSESAAPAVAVANSGMTTPARSPDASDPPPSPSPASATGMVASGASGPMQTVASTPPGGALAPALAGTPAPAADAPLLLTFTGTSWVQVKDVSGAVILSQTATAGTTVPVSGRPPFALVIGNADHVRTQFRGQPVDLAPHTLHNVARLVLK
ncbi:MAG: DUF4115 domain-containing protein, partial [Casimicrobiaceae bacterium]